MGTMSVNEIIVTPLKRISVPGGDVLHAMKKTDEGFLGFGEAYFSIIEKGSLKPWRRHLRMTLNIVVPIGMVRFVFVDDEGISREELAGADRYIRLTVPPGIWFAFEGLSVPHSLLLNIADILHDPSEIERKDIDIYMNDWKSK
jgi:dTDP-4-dehydrorhamnose 3,5-epimerase